MTRLCCAFGSTMLCQSLDLLLPNYYAVCKYWHNFVLHFFINPQHLGCFCFTIPLIRQAASGHTGHDDALPLLIRMSWVTQQAAQVDMSICSLEAELLVAIAGLGNSWGPLKTVLLILKQVLDGFGGCKHVQTMVLLNMQ